MIEQKFGMSQVLPVKIPKAASETFSVDDIVTVNSSGYLTKATQTSPRGKLYQMTKAVAATDSDYASNTPVEVKEVQGRGKLFLMDVSTGTAVQSMVGSRVDLDDHNSVDVSSSNNGQVYVAAIVSTSQIVGSFDDSPAVGGLKVLSQTVTLSDFTDGGATAGTVVLDMTIPKGAVVLQSFITAVTGFIGDTSAVITIGDGSDVDRYNTGTPSVFTTATDVSAGAVSGTAFHAAAIATVTLTVTSAADFTSVTAGQATVSIMYLDPR
jgi:hypothetical protein